MKKILLFSFALLFGTAVSASNMAAPAPQQAASSAQASGSSFYLEVKGPTHYVHENGKLYYVPVVVHFYDAPTEPYTVNVLEDDKLMWIEDQTETGFTVAIKATIAGEPEKVVEVSYKGQVERITFVVDPRR